MLLIAGMFGSRTIRFLLIANIEAVLPDLINLSEFDCFQVLHVLLRDTFYFM